MQPGPPAPQPISSPKLLLGEGVEEARFFKALLKTLGISHIQVEDYKGKSKLQDYLAAQPPRSGFSQLVSLAVTRDADADPAGAFQSVCSSLQNAGLPVPNGMGQRTQGPPAVSVLILPNNMSPGMLEDLCLEAVRADPAMPCVDEFFQCVLQRAKRQPSIPPKAKVHAWLASQLDSDLRLAEAAEKGYWPWSSPVFHPLKQFLQSL